MSRRLDICNAIVAALGTVAITGLRARWLFDGEDSEANIEDTVPQAIVVPGRDQRTGQQTNMLERELSGHVIFSTHMGAPFDATVRAAAHEQLAKVETALLALSSGTATINAINEQIPGVAEFDVETTLDTIVDSEGRFNARVDWVCRYRHDILDPRTYQGVA